MGLLGGPIAWIYTIIYCMSRNIVVHTLTQYNRYTIIITRKNVTKLIENIHTDIMKEVE